MDLVVVGGPHSGVGKTLACEVAIRALTPSRAVGAIKLTVADTEREGHDHGAWAKTVADAAGICGRGASCGVCETVSTRIPSRLITSQGAIRKPNTDTARLHDAGAVAVAWVIALRAGAPAAVTQAIEYLHKQGANAILIEGTTSLEWLSPRLSVMVATDPGKRWKHVAVEKVGDCDIVLRNRVPKVPGDIPAPPVFLRAEPLDCDLSDDADAGTLAYIERLQRAFGVTSRRFGANALKSAN